MFKRNFKFVLIACLLCASISLRAQEKPDQAANFIAEYLKEYKRLYTASSEAAWQLNTRIVPGDNTNALNAQKADEAFAAFVGSKYNIEMATKFLKDRKSLQPIVVLQLEKILYNAAGSPETQKKLVERRIKAETAQTETLFGYKFTLDGKPVSTNTIDSILVNSPDIALRLRAWTASKEVGKVLKDSLVALREMRNGVVRGLGYKDYFTYQVSDYGMTTKEMMAATRRFMKELWPLYRELHTYARYELAAKYGNANDVPDYLPAHWLPNRWAQDWSPIVKVEGLNIDKIIESKPAEWLLESGEGFYKSLGYSGLPKSFYNKSSLYPVSPTAGYSKNNHASAWHMDLDQDVRCLMSIEPTAEWYATVNHELGHIYYYMAYSRPEIPLLLRAGANRAFHEAFGTLIGMAAMQKGVLKQNGLLPENARTDEMQILLKQALESVIFIPFSAGVMTEFEHDMYVNNLPANKFNKRWWELVKKYQGVVPPSERGEEYCDAASKTHINDDAAQYYDYALSSILLFQFNDHIAKKILHQDPRNTNYYGNRAVGDFLYGMMKEGASKDWREMLKENVGSDMSAKAMLEYFSPLMSYLKEKNKGRKYTLPKKFKG